MSNLLVSGVHLMPKYLACPQCFYSIPAEKVRRRRPQRCSRCKSELEYGEDYLWSVDPASGTPKWVYALVIVIAVGVAAVIAWKSFTK